MTDKEAALIIERFAIHHAKGDLPYSAKTLEALTYAVNRLNELNQNDEHVDPDSLWLELYER